METRCHTFLNKKVSLVFRSHQVVIDYISSTMGLPQEVYSVETDYIANKKNNLSISNSQNVSSGGKFCRKIHSAGYRVHGKEILQLVGSDFQRHRSPLMSSGNTFCCVHVHYIANKYNSPSVSIDRISLQHVRLQSKQVPQ